MPGAASIWSVNPVALARLLSDEPFSPSEGWSRVEAVLTKVFEVDQVSHVFEHGPNRRASLELFQRLASARGKPRRLAEVIALPLVRDAIARYRIAPEKVPQVIPFLMPVADAMFARPGEETSSGMAGAYRPASVDNSAAVSWLDPVQGLANDCYLVSAMIALAWARTRTFGTIVRTAARRADTFRQRFYEGARKRGETVAAEATLPEANGEAVYAHADAAAVAWPGLLEKTYVMRRQRLDADPCPLDYQAISDRHALPQDACRMLAGGVRRTHSHFVDPPLSRVIRDRCCDRRGVTRHPTMAWTHDGDVWRRDRDLRKQGLGWDRTGLAANHAFAVLGVILQDKRSPPTHVVLRNPWGVSSDRAEGYASGSWEPGEGAGGAAKVELNLSGVFALRADWFDLCFSNIGWTER